MRNKKRSKARSATSFLPKLSNVLLRRSEQYSLLNLRASPLIDNARTFSFTVSPHHPAGGRERRRRRAPARRETGNAVECIFHQFISVGWKLSLNIRADAFNLAEREGARPCARRLVTPCKIFRTVRRSEKPAQAYNEDE